MRLTDFATIYTPNPRRARPETQRLSQGFGYNTFGVAPLPPVVTLSPVHLEKPPGTTNVNMGGYVVAFPTSARYAVVYPT